MMTLQDHWDAVPLNQRRPCSCSPPDPEGDWLGILLNAPKRVLFQPGRSVTETGAFAAIPLCLFYQVPYTRNPEEQVETIVVEDLATGRRYQGRYTPLQAATIVQPEALPQAPVGEIPANQSHGGWLNLNLADFVPIPPRPATYTVFVCFAGFDSNRVQIELRQGTPGQTSRRI